MRLTLMPGNPLEIQQSPIYPTIRFIKWRPQTSQGLAPTVTEREYKRIMVVLRTEIVLLLAMAMCASLMARGVGL